MTQTTATCLWNDSADVEELRFALEHGAVGATCNPVIAHTVIKSRLKEWQPRIAEMVEQSPAAIEDVPGIEDEPDPRGIGASHQLVDFVRRLHVAAAVRVKHAAQSSRVPDFARDEVDAGGKRPPLFLG